MAFTQITLVHSFQTTGGFLTAVLSEPMTNGSLTVPDAPQNFQLQANGEMSVVLSATDDPGTTTASGNPPIYSLYLQLPGAPQVLVTTAIPSGAVLRVIDWDQLPLANGDVPPAAPQVIMSLNDVLIIGGPLGAGYVMYSTSATEAVWGTLAQAGIQPILTSSAPLALDLGGTANTTGAPSGAAGGDLGGTYPNPQVTSTHLSAPLPVSQGGTGTANGAIPMVMGGDLSGTLPNPAVTALSGVNVYFPTTTPDPAPAGSWAFSRNGTIWFNASGSNWSPFAGGGGGGTGPQGPQGPQGAPGGGGGGGSLQLAATITPSTPGIEDPTGTVIYDPQDGDVWLNAWIVVDEPWDGTTPTLSMGTFSATLQDVIDNGGTPSTPYTNMTLGVPGGNTSAYDAGSTPNSYWGIWLLKGAPLRALVNQNGGYPQYSTCTGNAAVVLPLTITAGSNDTLTLTGDTVTDWVIAPGTYNDLTSLIAAISAAESSGGPLSSSLAVAESVWTPGALFLCTLTTGVQFLGYPWSGNAAADLFLDNTSMQGGSAGGTPTGSTVGSVRIYTMISSADGGGGGTQGPQGAQGAPGAQGHQGAQGAQGGGSGGGGSQGPQGAQGAQGVAGASITGPQGGQGSQGSTGNTGPQGSQGPQGNPGFQGAQGTSVTGSVGPQGNQGAQGPPGTGAQGAQGAQGASVTGSQGAQGAQGAPGTPGAQGNQGLQGAQGGGPQGPQGTVGVQGPQGSLGNQGNTGSQGNQGSQGLQGTQGVQGATGGAGPQGTQGLQGAQGVIGSGAANPTVVALTDAATIAVNAALGNDFRVTIAASRNMGAPSNPVDGQKVVFQITQGTGGSFTITWNAAYEFGAGLPQPVLSTTAGLTDLLGFIYNATKAKWLFVAFVAGFS